jgi:DNA polymerase III subunit chi
MRADFYILPTNDYMHFACRLIEKAYKENHTVFVLTQNQQQAEQLDKQLWTFKDISFIPHHLSHDKENHTTPVTIGDSMEQAKQQDILLLLTPEYTDNIKQFERVMTTVPNETEWKNKSRELYNQLKALTSDIHTHKI